MKIQFLKRRYFQGKLFEIGQQINVPKRTALAYIKTGGAKKAPLTPAVKVAPVIEHGFVQVVPTEGEGEIGKEPDDEKCEVTVGEAFIEDEKNPEYPKQKASKLLTQMTYKELQQLAVKNGILAKGKKGELISSIEEKSKEELS